ncbi:MAG: saccharopine dehydrogenase C-terminal domain-containing protein [Pseudomonadota bacterium]
MRIAVLGAGLMGRAAVHDLARTEGVEEVRVFDLDPARAVAVARAHGGGRAHAAGLDASDEAAAVQALSGCDAALGAISYRANLALSRACLQAGVHFCDLGGNNDVVRAQQALSAEAQAAGIALVPDCGLAPGLVSVLTARLLELMPDARRVKLRVGGLPLDPRPPMGYQIVFSVEGLINEYKEPSFALRDGEVVEVPTLGDLEQLEFPEPFGTLEAFNTSGGASTLPWTLRGRLEALDYKTIRYPGHRDQVALLFDLGLADEVPVEVDDVAISPRRLLERVLDARLAGDDADCILLLAEAEGPSGRVAFRLMDRADPETGLSAMMRCTAFPAAVVAHMLASGAIQARGTLPQEQAIPAGPFVAALRARGLRIEQICT